MSTERDELATVIETAYDLNHGMASFELLAHAVLTAGYRKTFDLSPGLYRNSLGVEIEVQSVEIARHIMGSVWNAYVKDDLFPRHVIVTPEGMRDAGYSRVDAS